MRKKYIIVYEYDDSSSEHFESVRDFTKRLAEKLSFYDVRDVHEKFPPHITLKAPFYLKLSFKETIINLFKSSKEKEKILALKEKKLLSLLQDFRLDKRKSTFSIKDVEDFEEEIIYWKVYSEPMKKISRDLCILIKSNFPEIALSKYEPILQPHIILAKEFDKNFSYLVLRECRKNFRLSVHSEDFDHFSLFVYEKGKYRRVKRFNLRA